MVAGSVVFILVAAVIVLIRSYKRCPKNKIMVVFRLVGSPETTIIQEGGTFVIPFLKAREYISLDPMTIELDMDMFIKDMDTKAKPRAVFTVRVSTKPDIIGNAAERLLGLPIVEITLKVKDIITGQVRTQIGGKTAAYFNSDRLQLVEDILACANHELAKVGIEIIEADIPQLIAQE